MKKMKLPLSVFALLLAFIFNSCKEEKPVNILYIMADDHAYQAISAYGYGLNNTPNIDRLAKEGVLFTNAFCTNSICAPSRAVVLTGKFSHINGHLDNSTTFDGSQVTVPKLLREAGYETAMIGKWHLRSDPTGFDFWKVLLGQGPYYNPDLKDSTGVHNYEGYTTTVVTDEALNWLKTRNQDKPFFLMLHHKAPHRNWMPEPKYFNFEEKTFPVPENYFDDYQNRGSAAKEQKMSVIEDMMIGYDLKVLNPDTTKEQPGDQWILGMLERLTPEQRKVWDDHYNQIAEDFFSRNLEGEDLAIWKYQRYMRDYLACIQSVDDQVGRMLDYLDETGLAENTAVFYTSDQGFYLGEHGWFDKRFIYEESLGQPLLVRLPGDQNGGVTSDALVQNLDFAETFLDLAGAQIPAEMQGVSLLEPIRQAQKNGGVPEDWRKSIYYHYYEYPGPHSVKRHYGVRNERYKLMHFYYDIDEWEMYDLEKDPHEMNNIIDDPEYADVLAGMKEELSRLQAKYGDSLEKAKELLPSEK
jgi:arylsulfatase A-like enzyme